MHSSMLRKFFLHGSLGSILVENTAEWQKSHNAGCLWMTKTLLAIRLAPDLRAFPLA